MLGVALLPSALPGASELPKAGLGTGTVLESLRVGATTVYHRVEVRSVNARSIMISHAGGLAAVRLRDLSPELQRAFGYSPEAEAKADDKLRTAQAEQQKHVAEQTGMRNPKSRNEGKTGTQFDQLLQSFGQPPELRPGVDLRPNFFQLAMSVKNQGPRPSCAIFAIVSALEYQNAQLTGQAERFSEEYLLWATCKILQRVPRPRAASEAESAGNSAEDFDAADEGFRLSEVVTALRAYGVPLQESLPYRFAHLSSLTEPPREVIDQARNRRRVSVVPLPGHDQSTVLTNLVHSLNAGIPIAVGMRWPVSRSLKGNFLDAQRPGDGNGHAVTIVGYENKTGELKDVVFIFKNSWGARWGAGGYGFVTYRYLLNNLAETALLEVTPKGTRPPDR